jgi:hypothetical protein
MGVSRLGSAAREINGPQDLGPESGHQLWWVVEAPDSTATLAELPLFVADRTALERVSQVQIPGARGKPASAALFVSRERSWPGSSGRSGPGLRETGRVRGLRRGPGV